MEICHPRWQGAKGAVWALAQITVSSRLRVRGQEAGCVEVDCVGCRGGEKQPIGHSPSLVAGYRI